MDDKKSEVLFEVPTGASSRVLSRAVRLLRRVGDDRRGEKLDGIHESCAFYPRRRARESEEEDAKNVFREVWSLAVTEDCSWTTASGFARAVLAIRKNGRAPRKVDFLTGRRVHGGRRGNSRRRAAAGGDPFSV